MEARAHFVLSPELIEFGHLVFYIFLQEASKGQRGDNLTPQQRREKCVLECILHACAKHPL